MAWGPISTFVQLYLLQLGGNVIDVGLASTVFNGVSIPAAMVWGFATDRLHRRKMIVVLTCVATAGNVILFPLSHTIQGTILLYAFLSLVASAYATPVNLLIMETFPKSRWAAGFSRLQMISTSGNALGLLFSVFWNEVAPLELMVIPLSILSISSAVLSVLMIKEPAIPFEREMIVHVRRSFYERLLAVPMMFMRLPRLTDFRRVFGGLKYRLAKERELLYISTFVFFLGTGIFNTSVVPSLDAAGVSESQIFLVWLAAMTVQVIGFRYAPPYIERKSLKATAIGGILLRSLAYGAVGVSAYFLTGIPYLGASLLFIPVAAGIAFAAYYAASNVLVFNTLGHGNRGAALGVYSALVGIGVMAGSFISGFTSFFIGYHATFLMGAATLAASGAIVAVLPSQPQKIAQLSA